MIDYEAEYNNRARVPEHPDIFARWERDAAAYRASGDCLVDQAYDLGPNLTFDLFGTAALAKDGPIALFIHGGYWQSLNPKLFSHVARGLNRHDIPVIVAGYDLCPDVRMADIIEDIRKLCQHVWTNFRRPIVAFGHSAGGHLTGAVLTTDWPARGMPSRLVLAGLSLSGLFDLVPITFTSINDKLGLDEAEALRMSPVGMPTPYGTRFVATVGEAESAEFHRQSTIMVDIWNRAGVETDLRSEPQANHFTVIDPLTDPDSSLTSVMVDLVNQTG